MNGLAWLKRIWVALLLTALGGWGAYHLFAKEVITIQGEEFTQLLGMSWVDELRPWLLVLACFLPAIQAWIHSFSDLPDRFVGRRFLMMFAGIGVALFVLWVMLDFQNRASEFGENASFQTIGAYYLTTSSMFTVKILPYCVLLASIITFSELSKHKEIISLIQSGRSLIRLSRNVMLSVSLVSLYVLILNFHWAPVSEMKAQRFLEKASQNQAGELREQSIQVFNVEGSRMWFFESVEKDKHVFQRVSITQFGADEEPSYRWNAQLARWDESRGWTLEDVKHFRVDEFSEVPVTSDKKLTFDWQETPQQLVIPELDPSKMGISHLEKWLSIHEGGRPEQTAVYATQFFQRFASAVLILIYAIIAIPLGSYFDRRSSSQAILMALLVLLIVECSSPFMLALGESNRVLPAVSAWSVNLLLALSVVWLWIKNVQGLTVREWLQYRFAKN